MEHEFSKTGMSCLVDHGDVPSCKKCVHCGWVAYPYDSECTDRKGDAFTEMCREEERMYQEVIDRQNQEG